MSALLGRADESRKMPGGTGLWIFIFSDLLLFGLFFVLFAHDLATDSQIFLRSQATLNNAIGLINTLLLLTGSWAVAMGTRVVREPRHSALYLASAAFCGLLFLALKSTEYMQLIGKGYSLIDSRFYSWYFILTGYHALHVAAGIILLWVVAMRRWHNIAVTEDLLEASGCYWHLVDLLWIGIFSIVYLI